MNEYERMRELASGNNQPNLNAGMILDYKVQVPPKETQLKLIAGFNFLKSKMISIQEQAEENRSIALGEFEKSIFTQ
jgi:type I restriction enzyme, S subunit